MKIKYKVIKREIKLGSWVTVLDTKNVRSFNEKAVGVTFKIPEKGIALPTKAKCLALPPYNLGVNYYIDDLRLATEEEIRQKEEESKS